MASLWMYLRAYDSSQLSSEADGILAWDPAKEHEILRFAQDDRPVETPDIGTLELSKEF